MTEPAHVTRLRARLAVRDDGQRRLLSIPGCWDGLSALLIEQAGFEAAFLTGGGLAFARFGRPDMGLVSAGEVAQTLSVIRDRTVLPLLVDADTGFGNALNVAHTVKTFERAGASAVQLEDQTFPKRCGHMAGKGVIPATEAVGKLKAALDARVHALIVARTDALGVEGLAAALERAELFLETGADLVFIEGPRTVEELAAVADRFASRVPLMHNLVEGGLGPVCDGATLERLGFAAALHPLVLLHGFVRQAPGLLAQLASDRSTRNFVSGIADISEMNRITGAPTLIEDAARYDR